MTATWNIGLGEAQGIITAVAGAASADPGRPVAAAVMDRNGDLVAFARMDDTPSVVVQVALHKAYTAARLGMDTLVLGDRDRALGRDLATYGDNRFTSIAGGVCLKAKPPVAGHEGNTEVVIGSIGISGRRPDEDHALAMVGLAVFLSDPLK